MKPYLPIAIAAGLVVAGLALGFFLTPALAPPDSRVRAEMEDKIALAQAMLASYSPTDADLLRRFDTAVTSQPSTPEQAATPLDEQVKTALEQRKNLISDARNLIQEAIGTQVGEASGASSAAATRLQTVILIEQAQILRREAGLHWRLAAEARKRVADVLAHWTAVDAQARSLETALKGEGMLPQHAAPAPAPAAPAAPAAAGPTEHSRLGTLLGKLLGSKRKPASEPVTAATEPVAAPPQTSPATAVVEAPAVPRPAGPPTCTLDSSIEEILARQTQSPEQRLADLRLCRVHVQERLAQAQQQADALAPQVQQVRQQIDGAKAQADAAQKKMLELERSGVDATEPGSLERFTKAYTEASTAYRKALRTISILTAGSSSTPLISPEEQEMLPQPAISVDPALEKEQRGVLALESDLSAMQARIETEKKLLEQVDKAIDRMTLSQAKLSEYLAGQSGLQASRQVLVQELTVAAREAVAEAIQAYDLESQAMEMLDGQARNAAQQAGRAASGGGDRFVAGAAKALEGDIDAARALVLSQRIAGLEKHGQMLESIEPAGLAAPALLPAPAPAADQPAGGREWATAAKAALAAIETTRSEGIKAATAAIESYRSAANDTKELWTLHTEIAAVEYVLGNLATGPEAEKHLANARREFDLATRDRRDRPEVQALRPIYDKLAQAR